MTWTIINNPTTTKWTTLIQITVWDSGDTQWDNGVTIWDSSINSIQWTQDVISDTTTWTSIL